MQRDCPTQRKTPPALRSLPAVATFLAVAVAALAADLLSKHYVFHAFLDQPALREQIELLYGDLAREIPPDKLLHDVTLRPYLQKQVFPGLRFTLSTNPGVVFGLDLPPLLVASASVVAFGLVVFLFATSDGRARSVHVALALILAGAAGNFYDRHVAEVAIPGAGVIRHQVRDFIDCSQLYYKWIFNLADAFLVVGVAMLLLHWARHRRGETAKTNS